MALDPKLADAYLERGLFYESSGPPGDAINDFERFLAISTDRPKRRLVEEELKKLR